MIKGLSTEYSKKTQESIKNSKQEKVKKQEEHGMAVKVQEAVGLRLQPLETFFGKTPKCPEGRQKPTPKRLVHPHLGGAGVGKGTCCSEAPKK